MIKHIGKHNNRKIIVLYRTVPDEDHMCLVVYNDSIPSPWQNTIKKVVESHVGQDANDISEVLHRNLLPEGGAILPALHKNGVIKKVPTNQVIMTPAPNSSVRLDELNKILLEMEQGEEAVKRLAEIDAQSGVRDIKKSNGLNITAVDMQAEPAEVPDTPTGDGVLQDGDLARMNLDQAKTMKEQAESMLTEASRLESEAYDLDPSTKPVVAKKTTRKKIAAKKKTVANKKTVAKKTTVK